MSPEIQRLLKNWAEVHEGARSSGRRFLRLRLSSVGWTKIRNAVYDAVLRAVKARRVRARTVANFAELAIYPNPEGARAAKAITVQNKALIDRLFPLFSVDNGIKPGRGWSA